LKTEVAEGSFSVSECLQKRDIGFKASRGIGTGVRGRLFEYWRTEVLKSLKLLSLSFY